MIETFPKNGRRGKAPGYRGYKLGNQLAVKETGFYDAQGTFAKSEESERMNLYAKPGTSAKRRQPDPFDVTFPITRYRSRRP